MSKQKSRKQLNKALDESASSSFRSVDTDFNQTDYQADLDKSGPSKTTARGKENSKPRDQPSTSRGRPQNIDSSSSRSRPRTRTDKASKPPTRHQREQENSSDSSPERPLRSKQPKSPVRPAQRAQSRTSPRRAPTQISPRRAAPLDPPPAAKKTGASRRKQVKPALREVNFLMNTVHPLIPLAPFCRLIREILQNTSMNVERITPEAIKALREMTECYTTEVLSDSYMITRNRKQVTLQPRDIQLLLFLRGPTNRK